MAPSSTIPPRFANSSASWAVKIFGWVECLVIAPSLFPRRAGDRVKTDRRDALKLARLLRSGDLTPVWIPKEEDEALRDLVRARAAAKTDLLRARHRLTKLLLGKGIVPPTGTRAWTAKYRRWLDTVDFTHRPAHVVFADYRREVEAAEARVRRLETELWVCAEHCGQIRTVAGLQALRGVGFISAVTIVAEAGDLRRCRGARQFMSYTGVVASEHSSGSSTYRGPITHTGNARLRHILGEAAHHYRHPPSRQGALKQRQEGLPSNVVDLAWKAQHRLHHRYRHLSSRLGRPKALTAVSRELAGFVWALGNLVRAEEIEAA